MPKLSLADELKELLREYNDQIKKLPCKPLDMMGISEKVQLAKFILHCQAKDKNDAV